MKTDGIITEWVKQAILEYTVVVVVVVVVVAAAVVCYYLFIIITINFMVINCLDNSWLPWLTEDNFTLITSRRVYHKLFNSQGWAWFQAPAMV